MHTGNCLGRRSLACAAVASLLAAAGGASAQCPESWTLASAGQPTVPTDPSIRQNHATAFDTTAGRVVLFGGFAAGSFFNDTWVWDGAAWSPIVPAGPIPAVRGNMGLAYDSARSRLVLFGGATVGGAAVGDTWEWDGRDWLQMNPTASPPARFNHAMAYDSTRHLIVMTGGFSTLRHSDTWEYDGTTWTQRTGTTYGARSSHGMAFDASRNKMVIFGGFNGTRLADTREFDSASGNWSTSPASGPSGRQYLGLDYDSDQHVVVLVGGQTGPGTLETDRQQDTWVYNGASWTQVGTDGFTRRDQHTLTYDRTHHELVVFGGYRGGCCGGVQGDTWTSGCEQVCYANCDGSTTPPVLNVLDFICFQTEYAQGSSYANCDNSTNPPILNVLDFICFQTEYAQGCP
jgi:galactose oxidase-like protein